MTTNTTTAADNFHRFIASVDTEHLWEVLRMAAAQKPMDDVMRRLQHDVADELEKRLGEPFTTALDGVFMELDDADDISYYDAARKAYAAACETGN